MIPNTLQVTKSSIANEAYLALHHVNEVSKVVLPSRHITSDRYYGRVTCYVTSEQYLDTARDVFYNQDMVGFSYSNFLLILISFSANIYLFKVNNRNTRKMCEICSKLKIKTPERRQRSLSGVFIVDFEHILHLFLVFLLLILNK